MTLDSVLDIASGLLCDYGDDPSSATSRPAYMAAYLVRVFGGPPYDVDTEGALAYVRSVGIPQARREVIALLRAIEAYEAE